MAYITIRELLEAGVHFGHQTKRWNPKMKRYIFGARNGIYIIDLQQTVKLFRQGAEPGDKLPAGELLGRIHSACGDTVEEIRFNQDVIVIGVRNDPVVHTGDRVGFVALEWDDVTFS